MNIKKNIEMLLFQSNVSMYEVCKSTGVAQTTLSRFVRQESEIGNMKLDNAIALNDYFVKNKGDIIMKLKNMDTGVIKGYDEWYDDAVNFFTEEFENDEVLQEEFDSLEHYLKWNEERGNFFTDLVECDADGNEIIYP